MAALHKSIRENIAGFHSESAKRKIVTSRASGFAAALASSLETATETEICLTMQHNLPWPMGKQFYREWWRHVFPVRKVARRHLFPVRKLMAPPVSGLEKYQVMYYIISTDSIFKEN